MSESWWSSTDYLDYCHAEPRVGIVLDHYTRVGQWPAVVAPKPYVVLLSPIVSALDFQALVGFAACHSGHAEADSFDFDLPQLLWSLGVKALHKLPWAGIAASD